MMEHSPLSPHNTEAWMKPPPSPAPLPESQPASSETTVKTEKGRLASAYSDDGHWQVEQLQHVRVASTGRARRAGLPSTALWFALGMLAVFWSLRLAAFGGGADVFGGRHGHTTAFYEDGQARKTNHTVMTWDDIAPSEKLQWHSCPDNYNPAYYCARLTVPMDYHRPLTADKENPKVHIAMLMVPGSQDRDLDNPSSFAESPMLVNPGGPGGSGVSLAGRHFGEVIQSIAGDKYDVIGLDPRGVGATTPRADCFRVRGDLGDAISQHNAGIMNRVVWQMSGREIGLVNSTDSALSKNSVRAKALSQLCGKVADYDGEASIFRYSNTPNVARDMLSIVHAWDEWRGSGRQDGKSAQEDAQTLDETDSLSTKGKLVYWGFSYGTLLGATFASMFPDKVGRVMLDGVVDADHYVEPAWMHSLRDTDEIYDSFFTYCLRAGVSCAVFRRGDTDASDIKRRVENLLAELTEEPYIILPYGDDGGVPLLLNSGDVKGGIFAALYKPNEMFPVIAEFINTLLERREEFLGGDVLGLPSLCGKWELPYVLDDSQNTVMCSDKRYKLNETVPELQKRFEKMGKASGFADVWIGLMMGCNHWPVDAKDPPMRWDDHPAHKSKPIVTSFPVLFLTNRLDPVTPRHAALRMTGKFANSSIVEQWASGHCTISCISSCTVAHIRAYLLDGVVPPPPKFKTPDSGDWAKCICDIEPWGHPLASEAQSLQDVLELEDVQSSLKFAHAYQGLHREVLRNVPGAHVSEHNPLKQYLMKLGN